MVRELSNLRDIKLPLICHIHSIGFKIAIIEYLCVINKRVCKELAL